jgi:hypothetical protein
MGGFYAISMFDLISFNAFGLARDDFGYFMLCISFITPLNYLNMWGSTRMGWETTVC